MAARKMRSFALLSALALNLPLGAIAHMEMKWPYSFRSKFNPAITDPDYSNTSPLNADGSNFPCKGYTDLPESQDPVVTYTPGQTYNLTLAGTATHGGGSCQISLSYDNGKTFNVIKSIIGGCPLKPDWDFTIPSYAPPSNSAILAWTWFNLIGNREMYMQCARVAVTGQAVQRYRRTSSKRQNSIDGLPKLFECNIGNGCTTLEMHEVVFPDTGNVVEFGTDAIGPSPGPGFVGNGGPTGSSVPSSSASASTAVTTAPTTSPIVTTTTTTTELATSNSTTSTVLSTSAPAITTPPFPYPNGTAPGGFYTGTGTGYGTGYHNRTRTRTLTVTEFSDSASLTLTSSAAVNTSRPVGGMFKTITIVSTLPPMPFLSGTTGTPTPIVTTILQIVPVMPNALPTASAGLTTFETIAIPTTTSPLSFSVSVTSTSVPTKAASTPSSSCTPGTFRCDSQTLFSQCVSTGSSSTDFVSMGSVAAGMQCVDDKIVRENAGTCEVDGALLCDGSDAFYRCIDGGLIEVGSVAPGMVCNDGAFAPASS